MQIMFRFNKTELSSPRMARYRKRYAESAVLCEADAFAHTIPLDIKFECFFAFALDYFSTENSVCQGLFYILIQNL